MDKQVSYVVRPLQNQAVILNEVKDLPFNGYSWTREILRQAQNDRIGGFAKASLCSTKKQTVMYLEIERNLCAILSLFQDLARFIVVEPGKYFINVTCYQEISNNCLPKRVTVFFRFLQ
jgi:hypothetical protein